MKQKIARPSQKLAFRPQKMLGQNFLANRKILEKIAAGLELKKEETVLEIGPGTGNLTRFLAEKAGLVIAIEKDKRLYASLKETLKEDKNVRFLNGDALDADLGKLNQQFNLKNNYKVAGNLPFYISNPLIRKFLEEKLRPKLMVFLVQKEVAERICSQPPKMNLLAVSVQFYSQPEILGYVSKKHFWPRPKVDAAILKITPLAPALKTETEIDLFFKIVKAGFSQPRKQIINNLFAGFKKSQPGLCKEKIKTWLFKNNLQASQRAATLSLHDWVNLTLTLATPKP
ncbi:MAG: ribosomal RNA small subunit methyltransferase A [Candidatus Nealsonbacteria bacterium CG08_land_8_20_14_0_20_43_11]|uniref:Ribosomal RNA small subunit methyltransferase A n=1 Tax=Candidatus Nealsonbacteria bacterium CG08_land_8_20_14_0_20_43_11 TaxID=1974706 RepID=A0A2M6T0Q4_9BACT|nr:MAG: ribosomal RNA small subunit methyltransferase A [Candidatus Nealsonbacteria bacterium CG08_land_8_20_14_0_20_43_11]